MSGNNGVILSGRKLGQYELGRPLGRGGMGEVYLAHDVALDRPVAVKVVRGPHAGDAELAQRFEREARAAARLNHPNIVQIYNVDVVSDPPYMAMEYVQGVSLDKLLAEQGPLPWRRALSICVQVASALECAHASGIIHRDIKPANIIIDRQGRARVTDFGIAKVLDAQTRLTTRGASLGTPYYMSPEHYGVGALVPASDLFSLGATVFEMVTGQVPFKAETPAAVMKKITTGDAPPMTQYTPDVPEPVQRFVAGLMATEPARRYGSATQVLEDLAALRNRRELQHVPSQPRDKPKSLVEELLEAPEGVYVPAIESSPRRRLPWLIAAVGVAVAAVVLLTFIMLGRVGGTAPGQVQPPVDRPPPDLQAGPAPESVAPGMDQPRPSDEPARLPLVPRAGRAVPPGQRPRPGAPPPPPRRLGQQHPTGMR